MNEKRNVFFYHKGDIETIEKVRPLYKKSEEHGFTVVDSPSKANFIISFGGDGTFLQAVRKSGFRDDCLYTGVSLTGKNHFYCDFYYENFDRVLESLTNNKISVRSFPMIEVTINKEMFFYCLNEFTIRSHIVTPFVLDVYIDENHFETFWGDGLVVSTPTGSSAYNKSVNGAVIDPLIPCFQVAELASINSNEFRTLGSPFILHQGRKLTLIPARDENEHPIMALDNEALSIQHVDKIEIQLSEKRIQTAKIEDDSFWKTIRKIFL